MTTRPPRAGEVDGRDYHFRDLIDFNLMVNREQLLEHAKVFGNYYGTPRLPVENTLASGRDVLFDIDWQGTQQLAEKVRDDLVSVFILPPSWSELEQPPDEPRAGRPVRNQPPHGQGRRRDEPLGGI